MKKSLFLMGLFALFISCKGNVSQTDKPQPVNLILDTDLGPDYDDVGAMALMHALADSGQVNILATLSSNHDERVVPCIEVLNTYFNRPDIPVGAPKSEPGASLTTSGIKRSGLTSYPLTIRIIRRRLPTLRMP